MNSECPRLIKQLIARIMRKGEDLFVADGMQTGRVSVEFNVEVHQIDENRFATRSRSTSLGHLLKGLYI